MSDSPEDRDLLAAEYVLGVLAPEQVRALEALALQDPALATSIAEWEQRLAPLAGLVPREPPPPTLWRRLALATGIDSVIADRARPRYRAWRSPGLWRATTVASLALAASLAFLLLSRPVPLGQPMLAALAPAGAPGAMFLVRVDADGHAVIVASGNPTPPSGKAFELWALSAGATAPSSLGVLPETGRQLVVPNRPGTQLLVSQEPPGGSPTGLPTGPVVFAGVLTGA
ncbi:MAG: anti-sigma factor [Acetobacteraceae bacterium]